MHICVEFEVYNTNISGFININLRIENKYGYNMKNTYVVVIFMCVCIVHE